MHSDAFDVIPYEDIKGDWVRLGSGSFGNVYKGVPRISQRINSDLYNGDCREIPGHRRSHQGSTPIHRVRRWQVL
ncbi:hypothetical protein IW261DRAFT_1480790 [Armillaria novae-zelandiae]|uniref:Protein kinase domain-containing protein n=1 Tax=Armillaria novae-zelandiae TaxID=153914 RepID=A0AA39UH95_9AGAR|nr:hypothetical protein IW261DRAFT_1480790 [Armillaria novae-zelandiae]